MQTEDIFLILSCSRIKGEVYTVISSAGNVGMSLICFLVWVFCRNKDTDLDSKYILRSYTLPE